jgi:hypothetical protein
MKRYINQYNNPYTEEEKKRKKISMEALLEAPPVF